MADEQRSREARAAAEAALARVVHHYGSTPAFVLLGGLVPELLCANSAFRHAGTTDVDVQVDLEIATGGENAPRLEQALRNAEFEPDGADVWRWSTDTGGTKTVIKFELLADVDTAPAEAMVQFDDSEALGALNLRGTGFATRDYAPQQISTRVGGRAQIVEINVAGLAGFLLAKAAAAHVRRNPKDWYDVAYVLLHNDVGGPGDAAVAVRAKFESDLVGSIRTALDDLMANFESSGAQGPKAYAAQFVRDHPELDETTVLADAVLAVEEFYGGLFVTQKR
jgi:hypothetical protein